MDMLVLPFGKGPIGRRFISSKVAPSDAPLWGMSEIEKLPSMNKLKSSTRIKTETDAIKAILHLATPCIEKRLVQLGLNEDAFHELVKHLTNFKAESAKQLLQAAMPLLRGDWTRKAVMNMFLALEAPNLILRMAEPWVERRLVQFGVDEKTLNVLTRALAKLSTVSPGQESSGTQTARSSALS